MAGKTQCWIRLVSKQKPASQKSVFMAAVCTYPGAAFRHLTQRPGHVHNRLGSLFTFVCDVLGENHSSYSRIEWESPQPSFSETYDCQRTPTHPITEHVYNTWTSSKPWIVPQKASYPRWICPTRQPENNFTKNLSLRPMIRAHTCIALAGARHCSKRLIHNNSWEYSLQPHEEASLIITPTSQMRKLRLGEVKLFAWGHSAEKWQSQTCSCSGLFTAIPCYRKISKEFLKLLWAKIRLSCQRFMWTASPFLLSEVLCDTARSHSPPPASSDNDD